MKFRTEYKVERGDVIIDPRRPVVLVGSCFSDNISARMRDCLWEAENPLGTLYNPLSIADALQICLFGSNGDFERSLFESGGMWRSWLFDSKLSAESREDVIFAFRQRAARLEDLLGRSGVLFVTFGTAWCYYHEGSLVANCHKQPGGIFERRRLTVEEIVEVWKEAIGRLRRRFPGLKVVFTVSPVRHLKDGFEGNSRSKAILSLAVEDLCLRLKDCHYFPAYEIINDDLRDYRFYASDLVHPSDEGVEYIWDKFKEMYLDEKGLVRLKEGEAIRKGLGHRPLPNATRRPSEVSLQREEIRMNSLKERLSKFEEGRL